MASPISETQRPATSASARAVPAGQPLNSGHIPPSADYRGNVPTTQRVPSEILSDTGQATPKTGRVSGRHTLSELSKLADFGAGKDGTLSEAQAEAKIQELFNRLEMIDQDSGNAIKIADLNDDSRTAFTAAVYAYLALNTGSTNAEDGFGADVGSGTNLYWADGSISGSSVREVFGNVTYRFMRRRATEIHDTLKVLYMRGKGPDAHLYPNAVEFCIDMDVVATRRGLAEYPLYAFVGAEYVARIPTKVRAAVFEAAAAVLGNRVNNRDDARSKVLRAVQAIHT